MSEDEELYHNEETVIDVLENVFIFKNTHDKFTKLDLECIHDLVHLYKKTKYELEGKEALVDTMSGNEEVLTKNYEILEEKLKQEKEKNRQSKMRIVQLEKEIDARIEDVNTYYISKDKIRAKMEEIMNYTYISREERQQQNYAYDRLKELLGED